jgi:hypothetical protein
LGCETAKAGRSRPVDAKGEANFTDVVPGKYDAGGLPNEVYSVERISWDGGATSGRTLNVPAGASLSLTFLVAGSVTVEGFAADGKGVSARWSSDPKIQAITIGFCRDQTD